MASLVASPVVIERLTQAHNLSEFQSTNDTLNTWLKRFAWTNQRAETAKTYVAHRDGVVVGYHARRRIRCSR